jgi:hypothetical protein
MAVNSRMDSDGPPTQVREDPTSEVDLDTGAAVWHIAVAEGQTQGPYTTAEMVGLRETGTIRDDMLVWQDGWPDWRPLAEVPEILDAPPMELTSVERPRARAAARRPSTLDIPVSMGDDPFGSGEAPVVKSPRVSAQESMRPGQGREGTVEINMNEFRRLSASSPSLPAVVLPVLPLVREDSGLIDVAKAREEHEQRVDTVPPAPDAPAKTPSIRPEPRMSRMSSVPALAPPLPAADFRTKILAGTIALGMVLAATVAVVAITHDPEPEPAARPPGPVTVTPEPTKPVAAAPIAAPTLPTAVGTGAEAETAKAEEEGPEGERAETASSGAAKGSSRRTGGGSRSSPTSRPTSSAKSSEGGGTIDDLLGRALDGGKGSKSTKATKTAKSSSLPDTPSRDDVMSAMSGVKGKVSSCKGSGVATARMTVKGSTGRVSGASVTGVSGAAKSCVERAVKTARFPRFQQSTFTVKFPFKLGG